DLPLVDRPVCRRPAIAGEATLRTFSPSKLLWAKFPSGKSEPQLALQPTGYTVELIAHPPRTGKVQTEPNPSPKAPRTTQELPSRYPSINAWFTQGGISRKDDLFKVVFNPGADKREKDILRETVRHTSLNIIRAPLFFLRIQAANDTGSARLCIQRRISETQLHKSIGFSPVVNSSRTPDVAPDP